MAKNPFNPGRLPAETTPEAIRERADELYDNRKCPHCGGDISLWEALAMVRGAGVYYEALTKDLATGRIYWCEIGEVNPRTSIILPHDLMHLAEPCSAKSLPEHQPPPTKDAGERES